MKDFPLLFLFTLLISVSSIHAQINTPAKPRPISSQKTGELLRPEISQNVLKSGPMLGYSEMREVLVWLQTTEAADIQIFYAAKTPTLDTLFVNTRKIRRASEIIRTQKNDEFVGKIRLTNLAPGWTYSYEVYIDGQKMDFDYPLEFQTQALWQWRTDPPDFTMAIGSCAYINDKRYDRLSRPYGNNYEIFQSIHEMRPDAMLWLGDNTYLREADWYSESGIMHRFSHSRAVPEMQPLLASTHHFAIWDDHDFGPNDSDRSYIHKDKTLRAFELFWGNPSYGLPHMEGGITSQFLWQDVEFFLLDNRYFRTPNNCKTCERTILGKEQINWLIEALVSSKAKFKMVAIGGQVLNTAEVYETYSNLNKPERDYILKRIEDEGLTNVIFLTGDRHHTEMSQYKNGAGNMVYDITVSPLTSGAGMHDETNALRIPNTMVGERNFGILEFTGTRTERQLKITIYDVDGKELWSQIIQ